MPRILIEGRPFEALSSSALFEGQYTNLLLQHADVLFAGLIAVEFNPIIVFENVGKRPDLALIDPDYRRWWVVEVELAHHSLEDHVAPQVEVLAHATYGDAEAEWLSSHHPQLELEALREMMRGAAPGVLVVVNAPRPEWVPRLRPAAELMVVEPFRSESDRLIFRQNGAELEVGSSVLTTCRVDPTLRRMLVVESPMAIAELGDEPFLVEYQGTVSSWRRIPTQKCVWLAPERGSPFPRRNTRLALVRTMDGRLVFEDKEGP